uniref:Uncharacterized protein n=1 Tax=Arundo donax TaxID=35708 RepID=A0A0A9AM34_ARUDO
MISVEKSWICMWCAPFAPWIILSSEVSFGEAAQMLSGVDTSGSLAGSAWS